jgi:hypothetical protein
VQSLLFDQGGQLGIADIGPLGQVAVGVVVVQDRQRDDAPCGVVAVADNAVVKGAVTVRPFLCGANRSVMGGDVGVDLVEHVAPVGDVGHVLEGGEAVRPDGYIRSPYPASTIVGLHNPGRTCPHDGSHVVDDCGDTGGPGAAAGRFQLAVEVVGVEDGE